MPGHMGADRVTTLNLKVVQTDVERGLILVEGAVPGAKGGWITVRDAVKKQLPKEAPKPGKFRELTGADAGKSDAPKAEAANNDAPVDDKRTAEQAAAAEVAALAAAKNKEGE